MKLVNRKKMRLARSPQQSRPRRLRVQNETATSSKDLKIASEIGGDKSGESGEELGAVKHAKRQEGEEIEGESGNVETQRAGEDSGPPCDNDNDNHENKRRTKREAETRSTITQSETVNSSDTDDSDEISTPPPNTTSKAESLPQKTNTEPAGDIPAANSEGN